MPLSLQRSETVTGKLARSSSGAILRWRVFRSGTWYVVALGLDASGEVGVLWDGVAVVIQRRELAWDLCVSGYQHRRQHCTGQSTTNKQTNKPTNKQTSTTAEVRMASHWLTFEAKSQMGNCESKHYGLNIKGVLH